MPRIFDNIEQALLEALKETLQVAAARNFWIPAVNNHGGFGRWAFVEIADPWNAVRSILACVSEVGGMKNRGDRAK